VVNLKNVPDFPGSAAGDAAKGAAKSAADFNYKNLLESTGKKLDDLVNAGKLKPDTAKQFENLDAGDFSDAAKNEIKNLPDEDLDELAKYGANTRAKLDPKLDLDSDVFKKTDFLASQKSGRMKDLKGPDDVPKIDDKSLLKSLAGVPGATMGKIGNVVKTIGNGLDTIIQYCKKNATACLILGGLTGLAYFMIVTGEANPIKAIARAAGQGVATVVNEVLPAVADSFAGIFQKYWWIGAIGIAVIILFMVLLKK
jgi:hypothetical protein